MAVDYNQIMAGIERQRQENEAEKRRQLEAQQAQMQASVQPTQPVQTAQQTADPNQQALQAAQYVRTAHPEYSQEEQVAQDAQSLLGSQEYQQNMNAGTLPSLQQTAQPTQPQDAATHPVQQSQPTDGNNYAAQAKSIGLAWSPEDADIATQYKNYLKRTTGQEGKISEIRDQLNDPTYAQQVKGYLDNDTELNDLASRLNAYHAKKNGLNQTPEQAAYTTSILRMQIAQNPNLYKNAEAIMSGAYGADSVAGSGKVSRSGRRRKGGRKGKKAKAEEAVQEEEKLTASDLFGDDEESAAQDESAANEAYRNKLVQADLKDAHDNYFANLAKLHKGDSVQDRYVNALVNDSLSNNKLNLDSDTDINDVINRKRKLNLSDNSVSINDIIAGKGKKKLNIDAASGDSVKKDAVSGSSVLNMTDDEKLAYYADPNRKLTKEEKKDANRILDSFNKEYQQKRKNGELKNLSSEEWAKLHDEMQAYNNVAAKQNVVSSFAHGVADRLTKGTARLAGGITSAVQKLTGHADDAKATNDAIKGYANDIKATAEGASNQNPIAYGAGKMVENAAEYAALNGALEAAGVTAKAAGALENTAAIKGVANAYNKVPVLAKYIPTTASKVAEHAANLGFGTVADAALDTLPREIENVSDGMNSKEIAKDAAGNLASNMAFNAAVEALPVVAKPIINKIIKKPVAEATQNMAESAGKEIAQDTVKPVENAVNNAAQDADFDNFIKNYDPNAAKEAAKTVPSPRDYYKQVINDAVDDAVDKEAVNTLKDSVKDTRKLTEDELIPVAQNLQKRYQKIKDKIPEAEKAQFEKGIEQKFDDIFAKQQKYTLDDMDSYIKGYEDKVNPLVKTKYGEFRQSDLGERFENVAQNGLDYVAKKRVNPAPIKSEITQEAYAKVLSNVTQIKNGIDDVAKKVDFTDKPLAAKKFEELKASYNFLQEAATSDDMAYISQAKKAVESSRKSFVNAMKKAGDASYGDLGKAKFGRIIDSVDKSILDNKNAVKGALPTDTDGFLKVEESDLPEHLRDATGYDHAKGVDIPNTNQNLPKLNAPEKAATKEVPKLIPLNLQMFSDAALKYEKELDQIPNGAFKDKLKGALSKYQSAFETAAKNNDAKAAQKALSELESVYNEGGRKVSNFYKNTLARGGGFADDAQFAKMADVLSYESSTEKESVEQAAEFIKSRGEKMAKNELLRKDDFTHSDVDSMMMLIRKQTAKLDELEKSGADLTEAQDELHKLTKKLQSVTSQNAQSMQALAKWSRNTPEGMLMQAENIIKGKVDVSPDSKMGQMVKKYFKDKDIEVSKEFEAEFLRKAKEFEKVSAEKGADSREAQLLMAEMGKAVNKEIPVKLPAKFTAFLMDNMLGNFRTLITRNAGGNVGYNAMEQTVKTPIAAGIDKLLSLKTGRRTQAGLSLEGLKEYGSGFKRGIGDELGDIKNTFKTGGTHTARIGENTLENAIDANSRTFKNPLLNAYDQSVKHGLSFGDRGFYDGAYKNELGNLYRLREKGLLGEELQKLSDEQFEEYAKKWAATKAKEAVYQDDSLLSKGFSGMKKNIGDISKGTIGTDILSQTSMPFVKTPANVLNRGIEYSPIGFAKNAIFTAKDIKAAKGLKGLNPAQQNRIANETARNLIGTGLFGAGAALRANGAITGAYDKDADAKAAQKRSGQQEYALDTDFLPYLSDSGLKGKNYNYDWVSVIAPALKSGAVAQDAFNTDDGKSTADKLASSAAAGMQTQFDQSFFQGLQRLAGGSSTYNSDKGIAGNAVDALSSGVGQGVPSLMRQVTQTVDPKQRYISGEGNYNVNSALSGIPGKRQQFEVNIDNEGNEMLNKQGRSLANRAWENMIDPGTWTDKGASKIDSESMRLYESTGNATSFLPTPSRKDIEIDGKAPTDKEFMEYKKDLGKANKETAEMLMDSEAYKNMPDNDKEDALSDVYSAMKASQRHKRGLISDDNYDNKLAQIYDSDGAKGVVEAVSEKAESKRLGLDSNDYTKDTYHKKGLPGLKDYQKANKLYANYNKALGKEAPKNLSKDAYQIFDEGGSELLKTALTNDYEKTASLSRFAQAKGEIPSLKYNKYVKQMQVLDSNHDGSLKWQEIRSAVSGMSKEEGERVIKGFYSSPDRFKYIDGKWQYTDKNGKVKLK